MLERAVEQHLVRRTREAGGLALKWVSPSMAGVPDRILLLPGGRVLFVEVKRPGGRLSALQVRTIDALRTLGANVVVVYSKDDVDGIFTTTVSATGPRPGAG